jgi:uncharacterized membrane protein HdeD (DUF308 family)
MSKRYERLASNVEAVVVGAVIVVVGIAYLISRFMSGSPN